MPEQPRDLSLAEHTVLAVVDEEPAHGFAIAAVTAANGDLGRVWLVPRPIVYRSLGRLEQAGLVTPVADEPGRGPRRQIVAATPAGSAEVSTWLQTPVRHVRDIRSHLLMKLALLDRRAVEPRDLVARQREVIAPILAALEDEPVDGFDATVAAWRRANARATLAFLDEVLRPGAGAAAGSPSGRLAHRTP